MSYGTEMQLDDTRGELNDGTLLRDGADQVAQLATEFFAEDKWTNLASIVKDIRNLVDDRNIVGVNHWKESIHLFLLYLTRIHRNLTVGLRGWGEEFEDTWIYWYHRGRRFKRIPKVRDY